MIKQNLCIACGKVPTPVNDRDNYQFSNPLSSALPYNAIASNEVICTMWKGC